MLNEGIISLIRCRCSDADDGGDDAFEEHLRPE